MINFNLSGLGSYKQALTLGQAAVRFTIPVVTQKPPSEIYGPREVGLLSPERYGYNRRVNWGEGHRS